MRGGAEAKDIDVRSVKCLNMPIVGCWCSFKIGRGRQEMATRSQKQQISYLDVNNIYCMKDLSKKYGRLITKGKDILVCFSP